MQYIEAPSKSDTTSVVVAYPAWIRKACRSVACGFLFSVPFAAAIPTSPLMRLSMNKSNQKAVMTRMMTDFFYLTFFTSTMVYGVIVESLFSNPAYATGLLPTLGPITAMIPGVGCLIASHLFYPGAWAIINERTRRDRRVTFFRLNTKCFLAFAPIHVPATLLLSAGLGCSLYPLKLYKAHRGQ